MPIVKIDGVVFCHNSKLDPGEDHALREECRRREVNLDIFGIDTISHDLYLEYPGLARDFLGVEVDTGQILRPDDFVAAYNKVKLATPLDTEFRFREEEVEQVLKGLQEGDLVIVSGRAGVGKSRLALECCDRFVAADPQYTARCVYNRYLRDLFEDLHVYFSPAGYHLIFVDDANRVIRFDVRPAWAIARE